MITRSKSSNQPPSPNGKTSDQNKGKTRGKRKYVPEDTSNVPSTRASSRIIKAKRGHDSKKPVVILDKVSSKKPKKSRNIGEDPKNFKQEGKSTHRSCKNPPQSLNISKDHASTKNHGPSDVSDQTNQVQKAQKICAPENLLDLMEESHKLFDLFAYEDISEEKVNQISQELKLTDSLLSKSLKTLESQFHRVLQVYHPKTFSCLKQIEIQSALSETLGINLENYDHSRPDAVFYVANTISLMKEILKLEYPSQAAIIIITYLYESFPNSFVREFSSELEYGDTTLETESFNLSLEIRTQYFISTLKSEYYEKELDLNDAIKLLRMVFLHNAPVMSVQFEDFLNKTNPTDISFWHQNSFEKTQFVKERVYKIYSYLKNKTSEIVDMIVISNLNLIFPWSKFVTNLVKWSNLRVQELFTNIQNQGGIDKVVNLLLESLQTPRTSATNINSPLSQSNTSQLIKVEETNSEPLKTSNASESLLSLQNVLKLQAMKKAYPKYNCQSNENRVNLPRNSRSPPRNQEEKHSTAHQPLMISLEETNNSSTRRYPKVIITQPSSRELSTLDPSEVDESTPEKNDSNVIEDQHKLSDTKNPKSSDPQNQNINNGPSETLFITPDPEFPHLERESSVGSTENYESEDQNFEEDRRNPDPSRRMLVPAAQRPSAFQCNSSLPKQASNQLRVGIDDSSGSSEEEGRSTHHTISQITTAAKQNAARSRMTSSGVQIRVPWSHNDEELLLNGIEKYGCSWSSLLNIIRGWEYERDQVALKDKARNMKVSFLKAGVPLPKNFHKIRLGKKEVASVKTVLPDYDPDKE
ncbi:hypothetical protein HI914_04304 [Erysiphe necator]|nr:hypothetical protein HI914_04304 [Erysiphe necator]